MARCAAFGAVLGHLFPVGLGFRGGKGVATTLGVLLALALPLGAASCLLWLLVAVVFRYSSLVALVAVAAAPVVAWLLLADLQMVQLTAALAVLVWRSEEHTSELQSLMRISYAVFCLKKKKQH